MGLFYHYSYEIHEIQLLLEYQQWVPLHFHYFLGERARIGQEYITSKEWGIAKRIQRKRQYQKSIQRIGLEHIASEELGNNRENLKKEAISEEHPKNREKIHNIQRMGK